MTMMRMMTLPLLLVLLVGVCTLQTSAFTSPVRKSCFVSHTTTATRTAASASASAVAVAVALSSTQRDDDYDDFASEDKDGIGSDYKGDIDWDGEWKKVVADQKGTSSSSRPGKEFYKSEAEIAAIRAANKAQEKVYEVASQAPSMPAWSSLQKVSTQVIMYLVGLDLFLFLLLLSQLLLVQYLLQYAVVHALLLPLSVFFTVGP